MTTVRCWLCGHEVVLSGINLITAYERYLVLTFFLSFLIRFRQYQSNVQFAWQFPQQWPSVLEVIRQNTTIFLTWTTLLPVAITFAILFVHTICYRLIWSEATVTPAELTTHPAILFLIFPLGLWMIGLDLRALLTASQVDFKEIEENLSKGEFALTSRAMSALRIASFGVFNPRKYVENRVADSLHNVRLVLLAQLRRWSFHTAVRITFGFTIWLSFGRLAGAMSPREFLGSILLLFLWLGAAIWWCWREPELKADEPAA